MAELLGGSKKNKVEDTAPVDTPTVAATTTPTPPHIDHIDLDGVASTLSRLSLAQLLWGNNKPKANAEDNCDRDRDRMT